MGMYHRYQWYVLRTSTSHQHPIIIWEDEFIFMDKYKCVLLAGGSNIPIILPPTSAPSLLENLNKDKEVHRWRWLCLFSSTFKTGDSGKEFTLPLNFDSILTANQKLQKLIMRKSYLKFLWSSHLHDGACISTLMTHKYLSNSLESHKIHTYILAKWLNCSPSEL